jgi:hypothetical protein
MGKRLPDAKAPEKETISMLLQQWQKDPNLAGLRDDKALSMLPEAERDAWKKLWADVAALLDKAKASR